MQLSEELTWRGFVNQTTFKDISVLDKDPITFYWGVDPSADSMTIGNFAIAMMVRHFIDHGHKAILLVGGATGLIGDPDGKKQERDLITSDELAANKQGIADQYKTIFAGQDFEIVDNYDWFKDMNYLDFLRDVGKHVPMSAMLGREFVSSRLGEDGSGISYAEFSYSLIQGYDYLHLNRKKSVTLQVAGADQWGNCLAGVDLIRRITGQDVHIWSAPLVVNKTTGLKFGKTEGGAIWLDPDKTSPTQFYQFWINCDDAGVEDYLKIYTLMPKAEIEAIVAKQESQPSARYAQKQLAMAVTTLVHGEAKAKQAEAVTNYLIGNLEIQNITADELAALKLEIPYQKVTRESSLGEAMVAVGLAASLGEARRLMAANAVSIDGAKISANTFVETHIKNNLIILRRGKAFKDSAVIEFA